MISSRTDTPSNEKYTFVERNDREWNSKIKLKVATTLATPRRLSICTGLGVSCLSWNCWQTWVERVGKEDKKKKKGIFFCYENSSFLDKTVGPSFFAQRRRPVGRPNNKNGTRKFRGQEKKQLETKTLIETRRRKKKEEKTPTQVETVDCVRLCPSCIRGLFTPAVTLRFRRPFSIFFFFVFFFL